MQFDTQLMQSQVPWHMYKLRFFSSPTFFHGMVWYGIITVIVGKKCPGSGV